MKKDGELEKLDGPIEFGVKLLREEFSKGHHLKNIILMHLI